ncbi:hypothetical protein ACRRTK_013777 [Alexandromys fortis]
MRTSTALGEPSPKGYIDITAPASAAQRTWQKWKGKDCKNQNTRNSAVKQHLRNDRINKTRTMTILMGMLTYKEINLVGSHPLSKLQRTTGN